MIPILTLAWDGDDRSMFGGAFVVDNFALILKAMFLLSAYVVVLLSTNYVAEGDYWENEYYEMLLASVLGMVLMASARDLITIFVALELLVDPGLHDGHLAQARPQEQRSRPQVLPHGRVRFALMLYGMSLLFGVSGSTLLDRHRRTVGDFDHSQPVITLGIMLVVVGFAFKVSAFPFHTWAPDTYEGAPTPVTSFLAVASKAAGFVALLQLVFVAFPERARRLRTAHVGPRGRVDDRTATSSRCARPTSCASWRIRASRKRATCWRRSSSSGAIPTPTPQRCKPSSPTSRSMPP